MSIKIEREDFTLNQVRFVNGATLEVSFQGKTETENGKSIRQFAVKCEDPIHGDLLELIDGLKEPIAFSANVSYGTKKGAKEKVHEKIKVTSINFYHLDEGYRVKITGGFGSALGYAGLTTQPIGFTDNKFGFEEELQKTLDSLIDEVYQYLIENKSAQHSMSFDSKEAA